MEGFVVDDMNNKLIGVLLDTEIEADLFQSRVTPFVKSLH
jgi:hypothetical protein